ncbi:DUF4959 domain-containing protein [Maribellus luteus]|uniref:DUF4959 domain-containing protein n=1 Tax=Maribellus luteus TaxID=2305463 RepID=A0A399SVH5_9BACT|nr:DUF5000 domain-containing lipoprotein [Maribellus luteus]RIJ48040.1 DUF4959 domain-containing protein [Maribellus luteus]
MKKIVTLLIWTLAVLWSCDEKELGPTVNGGKAPGKVKITNIENIAGGAIIHYDIPNDEDLLYVKAVYSYNNRKSEARASFYDTKLLLEGYNDTLEHEVELYAVDKGEMISEAVKTKIKPLESPLQKTAKSVKIEPTWGGAQYSWLNTEESELNFLLFSTDSVGNMELISTVYSAQKNGKASLRGYESEERPFAMIIRDRWQNYSDTIWPSDGKTLTPLLEQRLDKTKIRKVILANDANWSVWGGVFEQAYDDNILTIAHTQSGTGWPHYYTVDLGAKIKLSRYHMWQRQDTPSFQAYAHGNVRRWEVWGSAEKPDPSGSFDGWTKLLDCTIEKPSGLPLNQNSEADLDLLTRGHEFEVPQDKPEIRYLRFAILETWSVTDFAYLAEFNLFGNITDL